MSSGFMETAVIEAKSGRAKNMVIFLHGYGSNKDDLISIGREWQEALPNTVFLSPNAPEKCAMMMWGESYQWFALRSTDLRDIEKDADLIARANDKLNNYIDEKLKEYNLSDENLVVVGFSQGSMMALHTMPRREKACAGVVAFSGLLMNADKLLLEAKNKMPILAIHGEDDDVVSPDYLATVERGFSAAGFSIETSMRPNLGHGIDYFGVTRGVQFIAECLK